MSKKKKLLVINVPDSLDTLLALGTSRPERVSNDDQNDDNSIGKNVKKGDSTGNDQKLAQSSSSNTENNKNDTQLHSELTSHTAVNGESELASTSQSTADPHYQLNIEDIKDEVLSTTSSTEMVTFEEIEAEVVSPTSASQMMALEEIDAEDLDPALSSDFMTFEEIKAEVLSPVSPSEIQTFDETITEDPRPASPSELITLEEIKAEVPSPTPPSESNSFEDLTGGPSSVSSSEINNLEEIKEEVQSPGLSTEKSTVEYQKPKKRVRQPECKCPYCIAEGGNTTKGSNGKPQHICHYSHCGKIFGYAKSLYRHLITHSGKKSFVCPYCRKAFSRGDSLKVHVVIHMTDKRNKGRWVKCHCANCIKGGKKADCLDNKWKHICHYPGCGRAYTQIGNLQRHLQLHSGKKSFNCEHCEKGYARKDLLAWHMQMHLNEGRKWARCRCPYCRIDGGIRAPNGKLLHICHMSDCKNVYSNSWQLKRHLESHSGKKNYTCSQCGKGFARQDSFDRHVKSHGEGGRKKVNSEELYVPRRTTRMNARHNQLENSKSEEDRHRKPADIIDSTDEDSD